jgi:hypothetical protein
MLLPVTITELERFHGMTRSKLRARGALAITIIATLTAVTSDASAAASCPARKGTIVKNSYGRVWHSGHSLFSCTTVYGHKPKTRRLGPWAVNARVAFDGVHAAWTVPLVREGVRSDRAWAANADDGRRWLLGSRLLPSSSGPGQEARIQKILVDDEAAAWVTRGGEVVLAVRDPQDDPAPVGVLPAPLESQDKLLLVGTWTTPDAKTLAATARLEELDGDGDECGGVNPYELTVDPQLNGARIGATWSGGWTSTNCD